MTRVPQPESLRSLWGSPALSGGGGGQRAQVVSHRGDRAGRGGQPHRATAEEREDPEGARFRSEVTGDVSAEKLQSWPTGTASGRDTGGWF